MTLNEIIQEAQSLTTTERKKLIKALVDMIDQPERISLGKRSLRDFRGVGAHAYDGTDAQAYVNQLRDEWDDRS